MTLRKRTLEVISLLYIYIPIFLFLIGWTNAIVSVVSLIAIGYVAYRYLKRNMGDLEADDIKIEWWIVVCVILFFAWIGYYAGWGRWVNQTGDWSKHNAIVADLINRSWPVYYTNGEEHSMLVYYIAHYLFPAFIGKILGHSYRIAEIVLYIWTEIGLLLVFLNIIRVLKVRNYLFQAGSAVLVVFWGIPLWFSQLLMKKTLDLNMLGERMWLFFDEGIMIQYSNNFVLLMWVAPQVIAVWIMLLLFWDNKEKVEFYLFLLLPAMLFGTLAFVGIVPIALGSAIEWVIRNKSVKQWVKKLFSPENLALLVTLGSVFLLYFYGNVLSEKPEEIGFMIQPYTRYSSSRIWVYVIFVSINVLIYAFILAKDNYKDSIFLMTAVWLFVLPIVRMGRYNDLGMRGSIPGLFFIMLYVIKYMQEHFNTNKDKWIQKFATVVLVVFILNGMFYSFAEFSESVTNEDYTVLGDGPLWESMEMFANRTAMGGVDERYNYYAYDIENNIFQKCIARKHYQP